MKPFNKRVGFTIIETMLFLAITGVLAAGIFVGVGTSINTQRYRDSVTSLESTLKQQYTKVTNISNKSFDDKNISCVGSSAGIKITIGNNNSTVPGQSNCVLIGKVMIPSSGNELVIKDVIGYIDDATLNAATSDFDALAAMKLTTIPSNNYVDTYNMKWGSSLLAIQKKTLNFTALILRGPVSGTVLTFIDSSSSSGVINITKNGLANSLKMCVNSSNPFMGTAMSVSIKANAANANGIVVTGDDPECI